jgi:WD40 repeat protein
VSEEPLELPPVLAEPLRHPRRRRIVIAVAVNLAVLLLTAGVVALIQAPSAPGNHGSAPAPLTISRPVATLTNPDDDGVYGLLAFSPDGQTLATADTDNNTGNATRVYLWDVATGRRTATLTEPGMGVGSLVFSPDGKTLAIGDQNGSTYLLTVPAGHLTASFGYGLATAFSPDGQTMAGIQGDSTDLWNIATGRLIAIVTDPGGPDVAMPADAAFSPDGQTLATGDGDGSAYLWNVATGQRIASLTPGSLDVESVAFSPDGTTVAVADNDGSTYLWNVATHQVTATLTDPASGNVNAVAFGPDGKTLATADGNGNTYLWNVPDSRLIATLSPPDADADSVAFSPDGTTLATGAGVDGTTYLWDVSATRVRAGAP